MREITHIPTALCNLESYSLKLSPLFLTIALLQLSSRGEASLGFLIYSQCLIGVLLLDKKAPSGEEGEEEGRPPQAFLPDGNLGEEKEVGDVALACRAPVTGFIETTRTTPTGPTVIAFMPPHPPTSPTPPHHPTLPPDPLCCHQATVPSPFWKFPIFSTGNSFFLTLLRL